MRRAIVIILLGIAAACTLPAEDLFVEYSEGVLELKHGTGWIELYIGDSIPENGTIRLSENGFAELSSGTVTLTVSKDGTYQAGSLLRSGRQVAAWDIGGVVSSKLSKLLAPAENGSSAVAGVRGDPAANQEDLTWVEEGGELMKRGLQLLEQGLFDEAIPVFMDGADWALTDDEHDEYLFFAAYTHSLKGDNALALIMLEEMEVGAGSMIFTDYVLLKGKLLIENLAFADALDLFTEYLRRPDMGETTQVVYYLCAVCYQGLDENNQTRKLLQDAIRIDPSSEYGDAARRMLNTL